MTTDTTDSPRWVHRLGTVFASLTMTTLLFYVVFSFRLLWFLDGTWRIEDVGQDPLVWILLSVMAALIFVPAAYVALAGMRRLGVRDRYVWPGVGVASIVALIGLVLLVGDSGGSAGNATTVDAVGISGFLVLFGATVAVGTWAGGAVTRVETPLQNRRLLAVGAVLIALVAAPTAIAMAVEDPESEGYDPETGGDWTTDSDADGWNSTNDSTGDETADDSGEENESDSMTETTLGAVRCDEPIDDARSTPGLNHTVASNGTLDDDLRVQYYQIGGDHHVIRFNQWNETEIVSVAADGTGDPFAVDYLGVAELFTDDSARIWTDVVNDDGEVVRYQMDLCPPPEE